MRKEKRLYLYSGMLFILLFALWTFLVRSIDNKAIGPLDSMVGFSTLNRYVHEALGVNMRLYTVTDWLGLVPIAIALGFTVLGLIQLLKRKSLIRVDRDILILGGFYLCVMAVYVTFEYVIINYRPVLIDGYLEASYPSSTTTLVMCIIPTTIFQLKYRLKSNAIRHFITALLYGFMLFMVIGRLLSGVHWITDIIGGALISAGLVLIYASLCLTK